MGTNHVWLEKRAAASNGIMTPDEQQQKIRELLGGQFMHTGRLFRPDHLFYELGTDEELRQSARQLFLWLGIKPGHLEVKYGQLTQPGIYTEDPGMKRIIVNDRLAAHPYQCAAVLTHLVMHAAIAGRKRFVIEDPVENELFTNQALIQSGLALAVINGLVAVHPWQRFRLKGDIDPSALYPGLSRFATALAGYISYYRIHHEEYAHHLAPWIKRYLPSELQARLTVRNPQPVYIRSALAERKQIITKASISFLLVILLVTVAAYALSRKPAGPSPQQRTQLEKISLLKTEYEACANNLQEKRRTLDQNDIFQQQIVDREVSRCTSLRNQYNSLVSSYNRSLED